MTASRHGPVVHNRHSATITPIRVALVGDDEVTTRGLVAILRDHREHFEPVTFASRDSTPIDIALYDPAVGGPSRLDRLAGLLSDSRVLKVAIFTTRFEPSCARGFTEQGACAYLPKSMNSAEIINALTMVHAGQVIVYQARHGARLSATASIGEALSPREEEVLRLIASGLSNAAIAQTLGVSSNTVKTYVRSGYRKIDVDTRSKAVLWALTHGLGDARR